MRNLIAVIIFICVSSLLLFSVSGCAIFKNRHKMQKSAEQLAGEGVAAFRSGDYQKAITSFSTLKDWYPFSKYASLAQLKIADSHYRLKDYNEALAAYHEFETMHPKNDAIPYVIYREGQCWYKQIEGVDREQNSAKKAMEEFRRLVSRFPNNKYAFKAKHKIRKCLDSLAGHELYVAKFYLKAKHYKSALNRLEYLFAHYPDTVYGKKALSMIPKCQRLANSRKEKK